MILSWHKRLRNTTETKSNEYENNLGLQVIIGDFNLSLAYRQKLEKTAQKLGFSQIVQEQTHELGSVLDVLFTNHSTSDCAITNIPVYYSDHHLITVHLKL